MAINSIGKIARNTIVKDVVEASLTAVDTARIDFDKLESTIMCNASEETIDGWETWFGLKKTGWNLEDRRARLIYTFNSRGFFSPQFLKDQALIFSKGEIEIEEEFEKYHFVINFVGYIGIPDNLTSFLEMVDINKPAHLTFEMVFRHRVHRELKEFQHSTLKKYTHKELREIRTITKGGNYELQG